MDEHIDIRTYPIPNWSSRKVSVVQNGRWSYFYNSGNNETLFDYEPYSKKTISILSQRDKESVKNKSTNLNTSANFKENDGGDPPLNYDSYQLFQQSIQREKMQQQIFLTPTFSKPEKKPKESKKRETQKLNETFVPSETNIVDEIKPIIPLSPGLSVAKVKKDKVKSLANDNVNDNDENENDRTFCFNAKTNDIKNHHAFQFYKPPPKKEIKGEEKTKRLIEDCISSKRNGQSISQLRRYNGNSNRAFTFQMINNKKYSHSSTYNFGDNTHT